MILSLKLYESGPKALREVGGPSRIRMTKRFSKSFVSVRTLLLCPTVFFFLPFLVQIMRQSQRTLFFCYLWTIQSLTIRMDGLGVGVVFTLENLWAGENKKTEPQAWRNIGDSRIKTFPFFSHFTWPRRFRSSEKRIVSGSRRIKSDGHGEIDQNFNFVEIVEKWISFIFCS